MGPISSVKQSIGCPRIRLQVHIVWQIWLHFQSTPCKLLCMQSTDIQALVKNLLDAGHGSQTAVAARLGVSASSVGRWLAGKSRPHPAVEGRLRRLARDLHPSSVQEPLPIDDWYEPTHEEQLRTVVANTLREIRETLHRSGSLSSRHESLDEISKLLFAHTISLQTGGSGISRTLVNSGQSSAKSLRHFVSEIYRQHLPVSLAHELGASDFELSLKESQENFAREIIDCFAEISHPSYESTFSGPRGADILNDVFGQFLADSFIHERELGQYLTPTEIVRFMSRLSINSLTKSDFEILCHPEECSSFGIILDPSCGVSSFLREILRSLHAEVVTKYGHQGAKVWIDTMVRSVLVGIDKSERMIRLSLTNLALFGSPAANLHFANSLTKSEPNSKITTDLEGRVKLILTNPPFGAEFPAATLPGYKIASKWAQRRLKSLDSELLYMERYIDWLTPNGTLTVIVPDSILTNRGVYQDLRAGIAPLVELRSVISLPPVTFGAAGTTTKTSIVHLKKKSQQARKNKVYFAICRDVGYEVTTRDAQRRKVSSGQNDLVDILPEASREREARAGQLVEVLPNAKRWDATFHAGLSIEIADRINSPRNTDIFVKDVAALINDRVDPRRSDESAFFSYIEISDVDSRTLNVTSKSVRCREAPSRARKLVRPGDLLVSTVRPERKTMGVVPIELKAAICSTGFAVLRSKCIEPTVLARLLQSRFASEQMLRNNIGIAYPSISEECLLEVLLPISHNDMNSLRGQARKVRKLKSDLTRQEDALAHSLDRLVSSWLTV